MTETVLDLATWPRRDHYEWFRAFDRPHFATTARVDITHLMTRAKPAGISPYRACLYAFGHALHTVPELRLRARGDMVVQHDTVLMSMTVPRPDGTFGYGYVGFHPDFSRFDANAQAAIETARSGALNPNAESDGVAYLSCMPWLDFTAIDNALPDKTDCIPRISWGKFVRHTTQTHGSETWDMAVAIQVNHAMVDGAHVGAFFDKVQTALNGL